MSGNDIYDPCFSSVNNDQVACPMNDPSTVTVIDLTQQLPAGGNADAQSPSGAPWYFDLAGGATCRLATGATYIVDNLRANGECSNGEWWFGSVNQDAQPWTVLVQPQGSSQLTAAQITKAWE